MNKTHVLIAVLVGTAIGFVSGHYTEQADDIMRPVDTSHPPENPVAHRFLPTEVRDWDTIQEICQGGPLYGCTKQIGDLLQFWCDEDHVSQCESHEYRHVVYETDRHEGD